MCNRYNIKTNLREIASEIGAQIAFDFEYSEEVFPRSIAPTMAIDRHGVAQLRPMKFGFGSDRASGPAFNNARVESSAKWPWKTSFEKYRCVVPMNSFREPCYWGPEAGKEVNFQAAGGEILLAAAIFTFGKSGPGKSGAGRSEAEQAELSMSLIMRPALPFVMQHGHHRSPFFLRGDAVSQWMDRTPRTVKQSLQILSRSVSQPSLVCETARQMAASWTKRKSANLKKRDEQILDIEKTGPLGLGADVPPSDFSSSAAEPERS